MFIVAPHHVDSFRHAFRSPSASQPDKSTWTEFLTEAALTLPNHYVLVLCIEAHELRDISLDIGGQTVSPQGTESALLVLWNVPIEQHFCDPDTPFAAAVPLATGILTAMPRVASDPVELFVVASATTWVSYEYIDPATHHVDTRHWCGPLAPYPGPASAGSIVYDMHALRARAFKDRILL